MDGEGLPADDQPVREVPAQRGDVDVDRLKRILAGFVAQHAENRGELGCPCRWCLEARDFIS